MLIRCIATRFPMPAIWRLLHLTPLCVVLTKGAEDAEKNLVLRTTNVEIEVDGVINPT
jgi:hypothetical protein